MRYIAYWNLTENPFQNVADVRFAHLSDQHREGVARLLYLIEGRKLGGVLIGAYGVGKSMILEIVGQKVREKGGTHFLKLDVPPSGTLALARQITNRIGHQGKVEDVTDALNAIEEHFGEGNPSFNHLVLALDEAQIMRNELDREFIHLLTNLRVRLASGAQGESAVTVLLAGHNEVSDFIGKDPALCQRLQLFWKLEPLTETQAVEYVHHRIRAAGGDIWMFEEDGLRELFMTSRGIPRVINNVCDLALLLGCAAKAPKINRDIVMHAIHELKAAPHATEPLQEVRP